ncbi:MAG TPA: cytochrome oxidase [Gammaproteobacteria bacterium]|nr:cytochrome oxidase [Gammaproteobacteria bacterium]
MSSPQRPYHLLKFLVASALFFFVGTVHGVLQVLPPIRAWLDSIGSPYGGPGHMIDPLAHAHINVVGGVVLLCMGMTYYMFESVTRRPVYSRRLVDHSFWWTAVGVSCFYSTLLIFGILEGHYLLSDQPQTVDRVRHIYGPVIGIVSTVMGMGFWLFFTNVFLTFRAYRRFRSSENDG